MISEVKKSSLQVPVIVSEISRVCHKEGKSGRSDGVPEAWVQLTALQPAKPVSQYTNVDATALLFSYHVTVADYSLEVWPPVECIRKVSEKAMSLIGDHSPLLRRYIVQKYECEGLHLLNSVSFYI
jgi:hypothetical protein